MYIVRLALGVQESGMYNNMRLHSDLLNSTSPFPGTGELCRNRLHHSRMEGEREERRERASSSEMPREYLERGRGGREGGREGGVGGEGEREGGREGGRERGRGGREGRRGEMRV